MIKLTEKQEVKEKKEVNKEENKDVVFIGDKNFMNYINAVEWQLKEHEKVTITARGKYISRAVDVSQVMKNRYECEIGEIKISSEEFEGKEGKQVRVSTINIEVKKSKG